MSITKQEIKQLENSAKISVFFRTDPDVYRKIKVLAASQQRDMQEVVLEAMIDVLKKYEPQPIPSKSPKKSRLKK